VIALIAAPMMAVEREKTIGYMEVLGKATWPGGVPPGSEPAMLTFRWALLIAVLAGIGRVLCGPVKPKSSPTEDFRRSWREPCRDPAAPGSSTHWCVHCTARRLGKEDVSAGETLCRECRAEGRSDPPVAAPPPLPKIRPEPPVATPPPGPRR
jgi:hypothetical protein